MMMCLLNNRSYFCHTEFSIKREDCEVSSENTCSFEMSTSDREHGSVQNGDINQIDLTALEGRMRSMSEVYSVDSLYGSVSSPDSKPSGDLPSFERNTSPIVGEDIASPSNSFSATEMVHGIVGGEAVLKKRHETRGRLFSELSISDMPTEVSTGNGCVCV